MIISKILNITYSVKKDVRNLFLDVFSYFYTKVYFTLILVINIAIWTMARYIYIEIDNGLLALHYNVDFGIDYYGNAVNVFVIPFIGLFTFALNLFIFLVFGKRKDRKFISHLLFTTSLITNIILFVALISIYIINFGY